MTDKRQQHRRFVRQLLDAVDRADFSATVQLVDNAVSAGLDMNLPSASGLTVLQSIITSSVATSADVSDLCRRLLISGTDANLRDSSTGETPLHLAARCGREDLVRILVASPDVELDVSDWAGRTPLMTSLTTASPAVAMCLVRAGCSVNRANDDKETALMICARQNLFEHARILVTESNDLDINATDKERRTALMLAVQHGHEKIVEMLIAVSGCCLDAADQYNRTPLYFAAKLGHVGIVERLIAAGADINKFDTKGLTPFTMAVEGMYMDVVRFLINAGCDVNTFDYDNRQTAMHNAVRFSSKVFGQRDFNLELIRLLMGTTCDVNVCDKFGQTPLFQAAVGGEIEIVRLLLEKNADVTIATNTLETPLHGSVIGNQPEITDMLIKAGCNVNAVNNKNKLPLFLAIENRATNQHSKKFLRCRVPMSEMIIELLLKAGSQTDVCESKDHKSPLYAAVCQQFSEAVDLLINAGCDVNLPDASGNTPLLIACSLGNETIVDSLLRHPEIDVDRGSLQVPLHAAAGVGSCTIVERLIKSGCDINKVTVTGMSALFQAADRDHLNVARLLIIHGASPQATARQLPPQSLCCRAHRDRHPHLELHPLFAAVENNNMAMIKLLLVASPQMPYAELVLLRDIIFRTKYAVEARLGDRTLIQYGYLFTGILSRPRALSEECRGVIRDAVCFGFSCRRRAKGGQGLSLAEAVDKLPLPDRVKEFVMLRNEAIIGARDS